MKIHRKPRLSVNNYIKGICEGNRILLSQAITLLESSLLSDQEIAEKIIDKVLPATGKSIRIGITGVPGVGKSTFIETFGKWLTSQNKKVAVLTIDPSSHKTKGSILGDKTRMNELAIDPLAFIRPSATRESLGGVAESTHETILLCEAAGYEIIIVETVGVGQSEVTVRNMTDFFLLLMLPGAGDELQGIKKGIMEMADGIIITKADGNNLKQARQAQSDLQRAIQLFDTPDSGFATKVLLTSSIEKKGISEIWMLIDSFHRETIKNGFFSRHREQQNVNWFRSQIEFQIKQRIKNQKKLNKEFEAFEKRIQSSIISPGKAAKNIIKKMKITFTISFLLFIQLSFAQNLAPQTRVTPNINDLFNGLPFARPNPNVVGDVYLDSQWALTSIEIDNVNKNLEWYWTRYDLQANELEVKVPGGVKVLSGSIFKKFSIKDTTGNERKFINAKSFKKDGVPLSGIAEIMVDGERPLLKIYHLEIQRPDYNPALNAGTRDTEVSKEVNRYYVIDGELVKIPSIKKFIASLGEQSAKVNDFIKMNNLSLRAEKDLISIFRFYNSLLKS
jgi:LAO/AO transport system kinase